jgi:hypothetical protein
MTAAVLRLSSRLVLVVLVYIQGEDPQTLYDTCNSLRKIIIEIRQKLGTGIDVVITRDFNRYNQL